MSSPTPSPSASMAATMATGSAAAAIEHLAREPAAAGDDDTASAPLSPSAHLVLSVVFPHLTLPSPCSWPAFVSLYPTLPSHSIRLDYVVLDTIDLGLDGSNGSGGLIAVAIEHLEQEAAVAGDDDTALVLLAALSLRDLQLVLVYFAE